MHSSFFVRHFRGREIHVPFATRSIVCLQVLYSHLTHLVKQNIYNFSIILELQIAMIISIPEFTLTPLKFRTVTPCHILLKI